MYCSLIQQQDIPFFFLLLLFPIAHKTCHSRDMSECMWLKQQPQYAISYIMYQHYTLEIICFLNCFREGEGRYSLILPTRQLWELIINDPVRPTRLGDLILVRQSSRHHLSWQVDEGFLYSSDDSCAVTEMWWICVVLLF